MALASLRFQRNAQDYEESISSIGNVVDLLGCTVVEWS